MKLKKLAAGACALALGASMMAMPASAYSETMYKDAKTASKTVTLTGETSVSYYYGIGWVDVTGTYARTWNGNDMKYEYTEKGWEKLDPHVNFVNYSNDAITYDVTYENGEDGLTLSPVGSTSGTLQSFPDLGYCDQASVHFTIAGTPKLKAGNSSSNGVITVGTITAAVTLGSN